MYPKATFRKSWTDAAHRAAALAAIVLLLFGSFGSFGCTAARDGMSARLFPVAASTNLTPADIGLAYEEFFVTAPGGRELHGWFIPAEGGAGTILLCHGAWRSISHYGPYIEGLHRQGLSVATFSYRGYERSDGLPSIDGLLPDTQAVLAALRARSDVDPRRIAVFGISMGSMVALGVARDDREIPAVIVENAVSPGDLVGRVLRRRVPVPVLNLVVSGIGRSLLIPNGLETAISAERSHAPLLVLQGERDLPFLRSTLEAYRAAAGPASLWVKPHAGHAPDALRTHPDEYFREIARFATRAFAGLPPEVEVTPRRPIGASVRVVVHAPSGKEAASDVPVEIALVRRDGKTEYRRLMLSPGTHELHVDAPESVIAVGATRREPAKIHADGSWTPPVSIWDRSDAALLRLHRQRMAASDENGLPLPGGVHRVIAAVEREEALLGEFPPPLEAECVPIFCWIGEALLQEGADPGEASIWFERCLSAAPERPQMHLWLSARGHTIGYRWIPMVERARRMLRELEVPG